MKRTPRRRRIYLDEGWEYLRGRVKKAWLRAEIPGGERVRLPHSWNEQDTYDPRRPSYRGKGGYRCVFQMPDDGLPYQLVAEGYYGMTEIFLDGMSISRVDPQFLGWKLPLEPRPAPGAHLLGLRMDNRSHRGVLPAQKMPDFILHGGLSGRVYLEEVPPLRFDKDTTSLSWAPTEQGWEIRLSGRLEGEELENEVEVTWAVEDPDGSLITNSAARASREDRRLFSGALICKELECWSPASPQLYFARIHLWHEDEIIDELLIRFGLTDPEFRPGKGFFLNGARLLLNGVNRHNSMPGFGKALPPELQVLDAQAIKQLGANFVRLSHYPQPETFLDACDELGLMVYPEIATWKSVSSRRSFRRAALRQMESMILRDRHRPSILLWGMGNESRSARSYKELGRLIHELDPLRPSIYAENHLYRARRQKTIGTADVWGVNYELDILEEAREASALGNVLVSECCNHPHSLRGDEEAEMKQLGVIEGDWETMAEIPWLAGYAVWCFADYATEYRKRLHRLAGLHDAWRQPKMAAELFRARHAEESMIAIFLTDTPVELPASRFRREIGSPSPDGYSLHIMSNCHTLGLRIDDEISTLKIAAPHTLIYLPDRPHHIQAHTPDSEIQASWEQPGSPEHIKILPPQTPLVAGETFPIDLRVCDAEGIPASTFSNRLLIGVEGAGRLRSFSSEGLVQISRGEGRVLISSDPEPGEILIEAAGATLPVETTRIRTVSSENNDR